MYYFASPRIDINSVLKQATWIFVNWGKRTAIGFSLDEPPRARTVLFMSNDNNAVVYIF